MKNKVIYPGWDTQFHFRRIMELNNLITHKDLLSNFSFNEFHGSGVFALYPYLDLLPATFLSFIIKSKINLVYSIFIFNTFLTLIISFYFCKSYVNNYYTSYIFSIIYGLLNTFLCYYIIVGDFGVTYSYVFLPIVIFSFLKTLNGNNYWVQLSLGMSLILYSHILNLIIIGAFLLIIFLFNINKISFTVIKRFINSIFLFIILTSVIWMPFIFFYFKNFNNIHMPLMVQLERINIKEFISGIYGSKSWDTMGFFSIISIFISAFFVKKFNRYIKQMYLLSLVIIISILCLPWNIITNYGMLKFLNQFQFTNRFLIVPQIILIFTFSLIISKYINNYYMHCIYYLIIFIVIFLQLIPGQYAIIQNLSHVPSVHKYISNNQIKKYRIDNSKQFNSFINIYNKEDDDYIPKAALHMSPYVNKNLGFYDNHHKIQFNHTGYNTFKVNIKSRINKLSLPIYVYNNENLHIYLNNKLVNSYDSKQGLLTINNIQNNIKSNNDIYIQPFQDPFKIVGYILSILGWLFVLGIVIKRKFIH